MRRLYLLIILFSFASAKAQTINPSGVYTFSGKTYKKKGHTYGYFGTVKVLLINSNRILMNFYVCKGAPSYNSGSFIDTLEYKDNTAVYRGDTSLVETTCRLVFKFSSKGFDSELSSDYPNMACGFGHAVDVFGFFKKLKRKAPTMNEMLEDPLMKEQTSSN